MSHYSKEDLIQTLSDGSDLHEHFAFLDELLVKFQSDVENSTNGNIELAELRLSELFSAFLAAKMALSIHADLTHYEFTSFLSFFEKYYLVAKDFVSSGIGSTERLKDEFSNVHGQYQQCVNPMLKDRYQDLKSQIEKY